VSRRRLLFGLLAALAIYTFEVSYLAQHLAAFLPTPPEAEATAVVQRYFEALQQHQFAAAYQLLSPGYRQRVSYERFLRVVEARQLEETGQPVLASSRPMRGQWILLEAFVPTRSGLRALQFVLRKANGHWWIDLLSEWPYRRERSDNI
jgi:hypothetical protein